MRAIILCVFFLEFAFIVNSLYEGHCVEYENEDGRFYYTPSFDAGGIRDIARNNASYSESPNSTTYIYPDLTGIGCDGGRVIGVHFCYKIRRKLSPPYVIGNRWNIFSLSVLRRHDTSFDVVQTIKISSEPNDTNMVCTRPMDFNYCCDYWRLDRSQQFELSRTNLAISITLWNHRASLLGWNSSFSEYKVSQYVLQSSSNYTNPGSSFNLPSSVRFTNDTLKLVRLNIEPIPLQATTSSFLASSTLLPLTTSTLQQSTISTMPLSTTLTRQPSTLQSLTTTTLQPTTTSTPQPSTTSTLQPLTTSILQPSTTSALRPPNTSTLQSLNSSTSEPPSTSTLQPLNTSPPSTSGDTDDSISISESFLNSQTGLIVIVSVIGGVIVLVIILCIPIVILLVKFQLQKQKLNAAKRYGSSSNLYDNAMYMTDVAKARARDDFGATNPVYHYAETKKDLRSSIIESCTKEHLEEEYAYVSTNNAVVNSPYGAEASHYNTLNRSEDVYEEPPNDIHKLYARLEDYKTNIVTRAAVGLGGLLGSGQFGEVYQGVWKSSNGDIPVAVKTLKEKCDQEERIKFFQEAAIMSQFKHANVVTMYGSITVGEPALIVLEMLEKGDLRKYLLSMRSDSGGCISIQLTDRDLLKYCRHVASGMKYLSDKAFVHRDLAARNILVSGDHVCKIADFGMSRDLMDETYYVSKGGIIPVKWTAPEALHYKKYSTASDVWSFGVVMFEIWSVGHKPFDGLKNNKVMKMIDSGYRLPPPPGCPRFIYNIMMSCWSLRFEERPAFTDLMKQLGRADSQILFSSEEDKKGVSESAFKLGSDLHYGNSLYKDLQVKYIPTHEVYSNQDVDSNSDYM